MLLLLSVPLPHLLGRTIGFVHVGVRKSESPSPNQNKFQNNPKYQDKSVDIIEKYKNGLVSEMLSCCDKAQTKSRVKVHSSSLINQFSNSWMAHQLNQNQLEKYVDENHKTKVSWTKTEWHAYTNKLGRKFEFPKKNDLFIFHKFS